MSKIAGLLIGIVAMGAAGCGYTTHAYRTTSEYRTIYVEPFVNKIDTTNEYAEGRRFVAYFPLLENTITNGVVDRYIMDGNLKVAKAEEADLRLIGELVNYKRESLRNSTEDVPEEYRVTVFVNVKLLDSTNQKVLWEKTDFTGQASYFTTGKFVKSESQAVGDAVTDLARRIVEVTVEEW